MENKDEGEEMEGAFGQDNRKASKLKLEIFVSRKTKQKGRTPAMGNTHKKSIPEILASLHFPAFN